MTTGEQSAICNLLSLNKTPTKTGTKIKFVNRAPITHFLLHCLRFINLFCNYYHIYYSVIGVSPCYTLEYIYCGRGSKCHVIVEVRGVEIGTDQFSMVFITPGCLFTSQILHLIFPYFNCADPQPAALGFASAIWWSPLGRRCYFQRNTCCSLVTTYKKHYLQSNE